MNVKRAEDVLMHKRLLQLACDPANRTTFNIHLVRLIDQSKMIIVAAVLVEMAFVFYLIGCWMLYASSINEINGAIASSSSVGGS